MEGKNNGLILHQKQREENSEVKRLPQGHPTLQVAKSSCENWNISCQSAYFLTLLWYLAMCLHLLALNAKRIMEEKHI